MNIPILTLGWWIPSIFILILILIENVLKIRRDRWTEDNAKVDLVVFGLDSIGVFRIISYSLSLGIGYFFLQNLSFFREMNLLDHVDSHYLRVLLVFFYMDLLSYSYHRFSHRSKVIWELHKMHHSATALRFITFNRRHPIESEVKIVLTAIPTAIIGADIHTFFAIALFQKMYGVFVHSSWQIYYPNFLKYLFVAPTFHQYHHRVSLDQPGNYGAVLAIWDYFFGTYFDPPAHENYKIGLTEDLKGKSFLGLTFLFQKNFFKKLF